MVLWRISNYCDLSGIGAQTVSARWHTAGEEKRIVYTAEHPALALLEVLVHLNRNPNRLPSVFQLLKISTPDEIAVEVVERETLGSGWQDDARTTQPIGDSWLAVSRTALLKVPATPSPESWNYLLNPLHPDARQIAIEWCRWITYDERLFGINADRETGLRNLASRYSNL